MRELEQRAERMEEDLRNENNYLQLQNKQLKDYERQYDILRKEFKIEDIREFS